MSRFLLDTNVLLDMVCGDRTNNKITYQFMLQAFLKGTHRLYAAAGSLKDVYYVYCRHYGQELEARKMIEMLKESTDIVDLTGDVLSLALLDDEPDFEDGIIRVSAKQAKCDYIVSYDAKAFKDSSVPRITTEQALQIVLERA